MTARAAWLPFAVSAVLVLGLVPSLARVARSVGLVDKPDGSRKLHETPIPLVGGIAVFLAGLASVLAAIVLLRLPTGAADGRELLGLLGASALLVGVGVADDRFGLRGRQKLLGQVAAVTLLVATGYQFTQFVVFVPIRFGSFALVVVYAWCLAAINAMNLLDGADGFASTVGLIASVAMGVLCLAQNRYVDSAICFSLAGGLAGFLRFNFPPATAYLGDAGSMLVGLVLAAISIRSSFKQAAMYAVAAPAAMLAIPFIDTAAAVVRRRLTGRSLYHEDRGHMHHLMAGFGPVRRLAWVALLSSITATGGVLAIVLQQSAYAVASVILVLLVMVGGGIFGRVEAALLARSLVAVARSFLRVPATRQQAISESAVQIQGERPWEQAWSRLAGFAVERDLNQITLDVNAPWMHEAYHADWKRPGVRTSPSHQWQVELPLIVSGRILGRVLVRADRTRCLSHRDLVASLMELTADIERSIVEAELPGAPLVPGVQVA